MRLRERIWPLMAVLLAGLALTACTTVTGGEDGMHRADTPQSRENAAAVHTQLGHALMNQGRLKEALEKLLMAVQFDDGYAPAHTLLGALYTRISNLPEAEKHYRKAVALKPKDGATNNNFAVFLCQEGKLQQAMPYFKKALADPFYKTPAAAWANIGICRMRAAQYQQAVSDFDKALGIAPRYAPALYQMALAKYRLGDAFHASAYIQRYMSLGHPGAQALKLGYDIETRLGNAEGAQDYARQLRSSFPDSKQAQALDAQTSQ